MADRSFGWPNPKFIEYELVEHLLDWIDEHASVLGDEASLYEDFVQVILDWVIGHYDPQDLYGSDRLKKWAESHGYVHEDSLATERHRWM